MTDPQLLEFIVVFSLFGVGFVAGYLYCILSLRKELIRLNTELENTLVDSQTKNVPAIKFPTLLKLETINNVHYFFDSVNNHFVCQGTTFEEAARNYKLSRNDTGYFFVDSDTQTLYYFENGTVKKKTKHDAIDVK